MASTTDPLQFAKNIRARGMEVRKHARLLVQQAALRCDQVVVLETPVDTGRARAGWVASVNDPIFHDPGEGRSSGFSEPQANATFLSMEAAKIAIATYGLDDHSIWITNVVPYIGELNFGSAVHEPGEMMQHGVLAAAQVIRDGKLLKP